MGFIIGTILGLLIGAVIGISLTFDLVARRQPLKRGITGGAGRGP